MGQALAFDSGHPHPQQLRLFLHAFSGIQEFFTDFICSSSLTLHLLFLFYVMFLHGDAL